MYFREPRGAVRLGKSPRAVDIQSELIRQGVAHGGLSTKSTTRDDVYNLKILLFSGLVAHYANSSEKRKQSSRDQSSVSLNRS
jgi:hypothetical protein